MASKGLHIVNQDCAHLILKSFNSSLTEKKQKQLILSDTPCEFLQLNVPAPLMRFILPIICLPPPFLFVSGGRIRPLFSCVLYEVTERVSRWQRVYSGIIYWDTCKSKTLPTFSNLSCPILTQPHFIHGATCYLLSCIINP